MPTDQPEDQPKDQRAPSATNHPLGGTSSAAQKFRDGIESKQSEIDDYDPEEEL